MRQWRAFETKEQQEAFEKEQSELYPDFKVCMRMTGKELEKEMYMPEGRMDGCDYVTVYRYED